MDTRITPSLIPLDAGALLVTGHDVRDLLHRCCEAGNPALLLAVDGQGISNGRFLGLGRDWVSFAITKSEAIRPHAMFRITFDWRNHVCLFLGLALPPSRSAEGPDVVRVSLPAWIVRADCRSAFRVPLPEDCPLQVRVHLEEQADLPARAVDLSVCGIQVHFPDPLPRILFPGDEVSLDLQLGENAVRLDAEVRRRQGQGYGLLFRRPEGPEAEPPESLTTIFRILEKDWLASQITD